MPGKALERKTKADTGLILARDALIFGMWAFTVYYDGSVLVLAHEHGGGVVVKNLR